jgi:patatin-like phospholipase/acyl hydrolase
MASAAAPTYFPGHVMKIGRRRAPLVDGGVVANNPTACAIAEGVDRQAGREGSVPLGSFVVASFGTGTVTRPIEIADIREWGALEWAVPIIGVLFDGAGDAVDYIARHLIDRERYFRFQTELTVASDDMDDASPENVNRLLSGAARHLDVEGGEDRIRDLARAIA